MVGTLYGAEIMCPAEEVPHQQVEGEQDGGSSKGEGEELAALMEGHQPYGYEHHQTGEQESVEVGQGDDELSVISSNSFKATLLLARSALSS